MTDGIARAEKAAKRKGKPIRIAFDQTDESGTQVLAFVVGLTKVPPNLDERLHTWLRRDLEAKGASRGVLVAFRAGSRDPVAVVTLQT